MPKAKPEIVLCCAREGAPVPLILGSRHTGRSYPIGDGPCRVMGVSSPFDRTHEQLQHEHLRCDLHNRPIVVVHHGAARDLPLVDQPVAPC